jgi:hypothetical protein
VWIMRKKLAAMYEKDKSYLAGLGLEKRAMPHVLQHQNSVEPWRPAHTSASFAGLGFRSPV